MSKERINLEKGTEELTILKGVAVVKQNPNEISIGAGNIGAPWQFLAQKVASYDPIDAHLLVRNDSRELTLQLNEKDGNGLKDEVRGQLLPNRLISELEINTGNRFNQNTMIDMLRRNRAWFVKDLACGNLITQLRGLVGKIEKRIEIADDLRGNTANKLQTALSELKVDTSFDVQIPIFAGHRKTYKIGVEVAVDVSQGNIMFYLLSDDLYVLDIKEAAALIDEQILHFEEWGCSVVELI